MAGFFDFIKNPQDKSTPTQGTAPQQPVIQSVIGQNQTVASSKQQVVSPYIQPQAIHVAAPTLPQPPINHQSPVNIAPNFAKATLGKQ